MSEQIFPSKKNGFIAARSSGNADRRYRTLLPGFTVFSLRGLAGAFFVCMTGGMALQFLDWNVAGWGLMLTGILILVVSCGIGLHVLIGGFLDNRAPAPVDATDYSAVLETADGSADPVLSALAGELDVFRQATAARLKKTLTIFFAFSGVVGGVFLLVSLVQSGSFIGRLFGIMPVLAVGYAGIVHVYAGQYKSEFNRLIVPKMLSRHGNLIAEPGFTPDLSRAVSMGMIDAFESCTVDNAFAGTYRGNRLEIAALTLSAPKAKYAQRQRRTETWNVFVVAIHLGRRVPATTIVLDAGVSGEMVVAVVPGLQKVILEDVVFNRTYSVYSEDQVAARALLTPASMGRMLDMANDRMFPPPQFLADGDRLSFFPRRDNRTSLFEPLSVSNPHILAHLAALDADLTEIFGLADVMIEMSDAIPGIRSDVRA